VHFFCNFTGTISSLNILNDAASTPGARNFQQYRSFKFYAEEKLVNGSRLMVGVMRCQLFFRSAREPRSWRDTDNRVANIPMWRNPLLVLDYATFWSRRDIFVPYSVPALTADCIAKYEQGLAASVNRIEGMRTVQRAKQIITSLQA
jgi:hypothetical protein